MFELVRFACHGRWRFLWDICIHGGTPLKANVRLNQYRVNSPRLVQAGVPPFVWSVMMSAFSAETVGASARVVWVPVSVHPSVPAVRDSRSLSIH
jgi:hypothetical protein